MEKSKFQFKNPVLSKLEFYPNFDNEKPGKILVEQELSNEVYRQKFEPRAKVSMDITINAKSEVTDKEVFSLSVKIESLFEWSDEMEEEFVTKLLEVSANTLLMSYARPIISQVISYSGLPPYNIPFFDFSEKA